MEKPCATHFRFQHPRDRLLVQSDHQLISQHSSSLKNSFQGRASILNFLQQGCNLLSIGNIGLLVMHVYTQGLESSMGEARFGPWR